MTKQTNNRRFGEQTKFVLQLDRAADHSILPAFHCAMQAKHILLPDGRVVPIRKEDVAASTYEDIWCDDFEWVIQPAYEQRLACILETFVNAGFCRPSGGDRYHFVLQCLSQRRTTGDLFDNNCSFIDRSAPMLDWRKDRDFCDAFPDIPRRCMNRLKDRIYQPRTRVLNQSKDDALFLRLCYIALAIKSYLARAGYPEFCAAELRQDT